MKRFLIKCTALLLILAALLWCGGLAYKRTTTWRNLERDETMEKYRDMPRQITFAVVGSSHGRDAFQQADYGGGFFNFSMSSQTPQYDLMQLRQFAGKIQPGATVVLTVSYFAPFWTELQEGFEQKQTRYYRILEPKNIVDCDVARWYLERFSPLLITDSRDVVKAVLDPPELRDDINTREGEKIFQNSDVEQEQARIRRDHCSTIEPAMPDGNAVMLNAYEEMLALCREHGWNAVLVTPPYLSVYTGCFSPGILAAFRRLTAQISAQNDVPWLDYSQHPDFTDNYEYFKNIDHLNLAGARAFSELVKAELRGLGMVTE